MRRRLRYLVAVILHLVDVSGLPYGPEKRHKFFDSRKISINACEIIGLFENDGQISELRQLGSLRRLLPLILAYYQRQEALTFPGESRGSSMSNTASSSSVMIRKIANARIHAQPKVCRPRQWVWINPRVIVLLSSCARRAGPTKLVINVPVGRSSQLT